jgi:hypothetical protein
MKSHRLANQTHGKSEDVSQHSLLFDLHAHSTFKPQSMEEWIMLQPLFKYNRENLKSRGFIAYAKKSWREG